LSDLNRVFSIADAGGLRLMEDRGDPTAPRKNFSAREDFVDRAD
jgi:hypothetical protein